MVEDSEKPREKVGERKKPDERNPACRGVQSKTVLSGVRKQVEVGES